MWATYYRVVCRSIEREYMAKYISKRVISIIVTILLIATVTFFLMKFAPGGPFSTEKKVPEIVLQNLNKKYGLDKPLLQQYGDYILNLLKLDFGISMKQEYVTTNGIISIGFPVSLVLGVEAIFLAVAFGVLIGIVAALHHNKWQDYFMNVIAVLGISVPSFIMATILQYILSVKLQIFPIAGWKNITYSFLPAIVLSLAPMAYIAKLTRSSMLEQLGSEYVKLAKAKGMTKKTVTFKHALRNAILPVISYLGPLTAAVITGSFVVESIFGIPGLGKQFVKAIGDRDYPVIMGTTLFYSVVLMVSVLVVDIIYGYIDPRIKIHAGDE